MVCPLNWGLGHATRCIPIIRKLIADSCEVHIASSGIALTLLKSEFPHLKFHEIVDYNITYTKHVHLFLKLFIKIPMILWTGYKENKEIMKIVRNEQIDAIISDNRMGCYSKSIPCVYLSHQIRPIMPFFFKFGEGLIFFFHKRYISQFNFLWIPDLPSYPSLSGDLAHIHPLPLNGTFIGILSRFESKKEELSEELPLLVILSGPEPQRSLLEKKIVSQLLRYDMEATVLQARPNIPKTVEMINNVTLISHLPSTEMVELMKKAKLIISRSGYTTLLELVALGKKAIFIPTPGQTEQEYLAKQLLKNGYYYSENQKEFNLKRAIAHSVPYNGISIPPDEDLLSKAIVQLYEEIEAKD